MVLTKLKSIRFLEDKESREELVESMPSALRVEYQSYKLVTKEAAFPGRVMIVYTLKDGLPVNLDIVTLRHLTVDPVTGPITWATSEGQGDYPIGMTPSKWRGRDLFLQLPQEFIFKWKGKQSNAGIEFTSHFAILLKTKSRWDEKIESHTYCATLNDFQKRFPEIRVTY